MNILFVVPYVPDLIHVRPYNLIEQLCKRGNRVTVLTLVSGDQESEAVQKLQQICERVETFTQPRARSLVNAALALPTWKPLQAVYSWHPRLAARLLELADGSASHKYDVIHIEHLRGVHYGLYYLANRGQCTDRLPVIWDSVDCISLLFRLAAASSRSFFGRWLTRLELGRTERYEGELVSHFDGVTVTSAKDREALLALAPKDRVMPSINLLPNGVNLEYFREDQVAVRHPAELVVSGKMSYHANITMVLNLVERIMPLIWKEKPDVRLAVVGKDPPREILALRQQARIEVTGTVPDIRPYLQQATIAAAPITYGAGIQNKVLEAMACGVPVVASPQAVSALQATPGRDVLVAQEPEAFARTALDLLADDNRRCQLGKAGRHYVERCHNWDVIVGQLEDLYTQAIQCKSKVTYSFSFGDHQRRF